MSQLESIFTRAWQRQAYWLWVLLPISWLYGLIINVRRWLYRQQWLKSYCAPIPVMVVGNISVGGSGKTPLIIAVVKYLQQHNVAVGVISRGYGGDTAQMPALVNATSLPSEVGDEPCLIVASTQVPMSVCPNRQLAIEQLLNAHPDLQLIIADDGLQHYALQRDIEWIVVDASRGFGNEQLLPTGFLREPMSRLNGATLIYHVSGTAFDSVFDSNTLKSQAAISQMTDGRTLNDKYDSVHNGTGAFLTTCAGFMRLLPASPQSLNLSTDSRSPKQGETVYAVTGIGYPKRFFETLRHMGYQVIECPFADHHVFLADELLCLDAHPIMITSKDAVKIRLLAQQNQKVASLPMWVVPVSAQLSDACYELLEQQLREQGIQLF